MKSIERIHGLDPFEALGMMVAACVSGNTYMGWNLHDLSRYFMPPISRGQYAVFVSEKQLVGFITWAFLSEEHSNALKAHFVEPGPDDWKSGNQIWFMDLVSTSGATHEIVRSLQQDLFRNADCKSAFALRRRTDGSVRKVSWFPAAPDLSRTKQGPDE